MFNAHKFLLLVCLSISISARAEVPVYAVLMDAPTTPYWVAVELGLKEGAIEEQVEYYLQSVPGDQSVNTDNGAALTRCHSILARKPNVLLVAIKETAELEPCFAKAHQLNIPVISLASTDSAPEVSSVNSVVLTDHPKAMALGAEFIASHLGADATGSVVIANNHSNLTIDNFTELLQQLAPKLTVLAAHPEELINAAPDIRAVLANDVTAIDTINSQKKPGNSDDLPNDLPDDLLIVSLDDQTNSAALLEAGKIHANINPLPYLIGKTAMQQASTAMNTKDSESTVLVQPLLVTKETLIDGSNPLLQYIR